MSSTVNDRNRTRGRRCLLLVLPLLTGIGPLPSAAAAVSVPPGTILTVAGTGLGRHSEDGGLAVQTPISSPYSVAVDARGNLLFSELQLSPQAGWIRKVDSAGILTTVAGGGKKVILSGVETPALEASLFPFSLETDAAGTLFVTELGDRSLEIGLEGLLTVVAGGGSKSPTAAEGGPALEARLNGPYTQAIDARGNLFIGDTGNNRVRKVTPAGIITTFAGGGRPPKGSIGDGGPAGDASLGGRFSIAIDGQGNLYIAEISRNIVRKVDTQGIITTVAGNGKAGFSGDRGLATQASLNWPQHLCVDSAGNLFIIDRNNERIRKVDPTGIITTVVGGAVLPKGDIGDGGLATEANLANPNRIVIDAVGNLYIADSNPTVDEHIPSASNKNPGYRVRKVFGIAAPGLLAGAPFPAGSPPGPGGLISGDLNFNGKVEWEDAILSLQMVIGRIVATEVQRKAGDLNEDGILDIRDTMLLLRRAVGF